jgi:hypothetical protein
VESSPLFLPAVASNQLVANLCIWILVDRADHSTDVKSISDTPTNYGIHAATRITRVRTIKLLYSYTSEVSESGIFATLFCHKIARFTDAHYTVY